MKAGKKVGGNNASGLNYGPFKTEIEAMTFLIRYGPHCFGGSGSLFMLYIAERTATYRKLEDATSLSQMAEGIKAGGRLIRGYMGLSRSQAKLESKRLLELGVLRKELRSRDGGKLPTLYAIDWYELVRYAKQTLGELDERWDSLPVQVEPGVGPPWAKGVGPPRAIQKRIYTETEKQKQKDQEDWTKRFESRFRKSA